MGEVCPDDENNEPDGAAGNDQFFKILPERANCLRRFQIGAKSVGVAEI